MASQGLRAIMPGAWVLINAISEAGCGFVLITNVPAEELAARTVSAAYTHDDPLARSTQRRGRSRPRGLFSGLLIAALLRSPPLQQPAAVGL